MKFITVTSPDVNNGPGFRTTLWVAGCSHHCKGCHNPETWSYNIGKPWKEVREKIYDDLSKDYISGLTLSGGDPIDQSNLDLLKFYFILKQIKKQFPTKNIWLYTGFTLEEAIKNPFRKAIIKLCDVIVDGPFILKERDTTLLFRGSKNQRIQNIKDLNL